MNRRTLTLIIAAVLVVAVIVWQMPVVGMMIVAAIISIAAIILQQRRPASGQPAWYAGVNTFLGTAPGKATLIATWLLLVCLSASSIQATVSDTLTLWPKAAVAAVSLILCTIIGLVSWLLFRPVGLPGDPKDVKSGVRWIIVAVGLFCFAWAWHEGFSNDLVPRNERFDPFTGAARGKFSLSEERIYPLDNGKWWGRKEYCNSPITGETLVELTSDQAKNIETERALGARVAKWVEAITPKATPISVPRERWQVCLRDPQGSFWQFAAEDVRQTSETLTFRYTIADGRMSQFNSQKKDAAYQGEYHSTGESGGDFFLKETLPGFLEGWWKGRDKGEHVLQLVKRP